LNGTSHDTKCDGTHVITLGPSNLGKETHVIIPLSLVGEGIEKICEGCVSGLVGS